MPLTRAPLKSSFAPTAKPDQRSEQLFCSCPVFAGAHNIPPVRPSVVNTPGDDSAHLKLGVP